MFFTVYRFSFVFKLFDGNDVIFTIKSNQRHLDLGSCSSDKIPSYSLYPPDPPLVH